MANYPETMQQEEAFALITFTRPDLLPAFRASGWDIRIGMWRDIVLHWWFNMAPEARDPLYPTLDAYLRAVGARPIPEDACVPLSKSEGVCVMRGPLSSLLATNLASSWPNNPDMFRYMVADWWFATTLGDPNVHGRYSSLDAYLRAVGCRGGGTPSPEPAPTPTPGPGPVGGFKLDSNVLLWLGVGAVLWIVASK